MSTELRVVTNDVIDDVPELPVRPNTGRSSKRLLFDQAQSHPGYGITPDAIVAIFRQAEAGFPWRMFDLFDDLLENDAHMRSLQLGRVRAVAGKTLAILPGVGGDEGASVEAAEALREHCADNTNFVEMAEHQVNSTFPGFAATEIIWRYRDGLFWPDQFLNLPERRFVFDVESDVLRLLNSPTDFNGELLQPGKWIVTRHRSAKLARAGLMRTLCWPGLFKRMAIRDWIVTMEKFGIPMVIGKYSEDASKTARAILDAAVEDIGEDGHATLPDNCSVEVLWARLEAGSSNELHPAVTAMCNAEMSKLVNGSTLTADSGGPGSFALGKVHENREFSLVRSDAQTFERAFRRDVSLPFVRFNNFKNAAAPRLVVQISRDMDPLSRAQVAKLLSEINLPLSAQQLYEEFGFRAPVSEADAVKMPEPEPPMPGNGAKKSDDGAKKKDD
jgi:phage gp29-like protein